MKKTTFLIIGKHAVLEAIKNPSRKIERVFLTEDAQKKLNRENQSLNLFRKINVFYKSKKELDNLCGRDEISHQGIVAEVEQLEYPTLKEFIHKLKENFNDELEIVSGGQKEGSDGYAKKYALEFDVKYSEFPPQHYSHNMHCVRPNYEYGKKYSWFN